MNDKALEKLVKAFIDNLEAELGRLPTKEEVNKAFFEGNVELTQKEIEESFSPRYEEKPC